MKHCEREGIPGVVGPSAINHRLLAKLAPSCGLSSERSLQVLRRVPGGTGSRLRVQLTNPLADTLVLRTTLCANNHLDSIELRLEGVAQHHKLVKFYRVEIDDVSARQNRVSDRFGPGRICEPFALFGTLVAGAREVVAAIHDYLSEAGPPHIVCEVSHMFVVTTAASLRDAQSIKIGKDHLLSDRVRRDEQSRGSRNFDLHGAVCVNSKHRCGQVAWMPLRHEVG